MLACLTSLLSQSTSDSHHHQHHPRPLPHSFHLSLFVPLPKVLCHLLPKCTATMRSRAGVVLLRGLTLRLMLLLRLLLAYYDFGEVVLGEKGAIIIKKQSGTRILWKFAGK